MMSLVRLHSELHARASPPQPSEISLEMGPFFPATFGSMSTANRVVISALLEFANSVFPEFRKLSRDDKWDIIVKNFYHSRLFEGCYRSTRATRTATRTVLLSELHSRPKPPHPLEISLETGPIYPATLSSIAIANRVLVSAMLDFAACVFPEFSQLENKEKWNIVVNNFYRFPLFEGCYRAGIVFPDDMTRKFGGFTVWMSVTDMTNFYSDAAEGADQAGALEHIKHSSLRIQEIKAGRGLIEDRKRVNPCHEEFLVVIAIMFWPFGDMPVRDEITQLGDRYREAILKELHAFYREEMRLDDYATRLGELMMPVFDRTHDMKEHFEMLNLLRILPEDNFTYQLQKSD
ncbi:hypothetical protein PENTCL1PPCAC_14207 [Pristionchus entomophagus]|uniref:NR LBD domain-containing protein n=1 Tax=Pristionchus entomophagus TaxID=358040 RepID=A0AAV5TGF5_9BILA|nr:hypothetical protein PENTCL1PPCAC_14207 [Pristionchus entomophagus]